MGFNDTCNAGLVLGLGFSSTTLDSPSTAAVVAAEKPHPTAAAIEPSLTLALSSVPRKIASNNKNNNSDSSGHKAAGCEQEASGEHFFGRQPASPHHSAVSSFSSGRVKRERDLSSEETEVDDKVNSSRVSDEDDDAVNTRKKLRLTKDQSALLEESFKQQSTLNPKQKQALARQLNLRPRQVEVWFQNRRARTKLKQTEVDCEFLKKYCETLTDENRRLQKELQELKALKVAQPFYMHMPAATLTMCPSCERIGPAMASTADGGGSKSQFSKPHHNFFSTFTNPSAAC